MALRSAWIPAPPDESEPAMVRMIGCIESPGVTAASAAAATTNGKRRSISSRPSVHARVGWSPPESAMAENHSATLATSPRRPLLGAAGVAAAALILYLRTGAPDVGLVDSGEFSVVGALG